MSLLLPSNRSADLRLANPCRLFSSTSHPQLPIFVPLLPSLSSVCWPAFNKLPGLAHFLDPLASWLSPLKHEEVASVVPVKDLSHLLTRFIMFFFNLFFMWRGGRKVMLFIWAIKIDGNQQAVKVSF